MDSYAQKRVQSGLLRVDAIEIMMMMTIEIYLVNVIIIYLTNDIHAGPCPGRCVVPVVKCDLHN
jgi:hypothetical protein